jgi:hypothetical protein
MTVVRAVKLCVVVSLWAVLIPTLASAQGQTGTIAGAVKDSTGAVLPGVTVEVSSPALIEKTRDAVTDGEGAYKIINLRPGTYRVTFTLGGFSTVQREGIELTASFTATINAEMKVGSVEETVTVTSATPIVDTQNVVQKQTASREVMNALPTDRNFVSFAALQPGVFVTGVVQNVGGSVPETGMNLVVHGSRAGDSLLMVDGMPIINGMGNGGLQYGIYLNNAAAQEMTFSTGGNSAEFERASVISNFIPKDGSNTYQGSFWGRFSNQSLEGTNLDAAQIAAGLKSGNRIDKLWDLNPTVGGPIITDRLWLFGGFRYWGTNNTVAGSFKDASYTELLYRPTTEQNLFPVWHESALARVTTQLNQKNKVNLYYDWQYSYFGNCFVPSYTTALSACPEYKSRPDYVVQGSWSSPVSSKLLLEAGWTLTAQDYNGYRQPGVSATQFSIADPLAPAGSPTLWGSAAVGYGINRSNQYNYRVSASYVTGSHAFKIGLNTMHQWRYQTTDVNNAVALTLRSLQPFSITQYAQPIQYHETVNYNTGLYAQDQWTMKRLTLNYGLRMDFLNASVDPQTLVAGPFTGARTFAAVDNVPNWKDLDPRLGVAYDLRGNGKTALKGSLGRYVVADSYTMARALNPMQSSINTVTRPWLSDPGGALNPFLDCDLTNPAANGSCGAISNPAFGQVGALTTNYAPAIQHGFDVRPYNWEAQLAVQQQVAPNVSVYAGYARRWYGNLFATQNLNVTNASYTPYCLTIPTGSPSITSVALPNAGGQQCGYYNLTPDGLAQGTQNLVANSSTLSGVTLHDVYDGFDLDVNARLAKGVTIGGGFNVGRERTNSCDLSSNLSYLFQTAVGASTGSGATILAPRTPAFCDVHPPFQPNVKASVSYPTPWYGVTISANFQSLPGPQLNAQYPLSNTTPGLTLGRNFSSTAPTVDLLAPGTLYGDRINQTDLRISDSIKTGRLVIRPTISVYNLFNANPVLTYSNTYGPAWLAPQVILTPRFMDFGVQIDF